MLVSPSHGWLCTYHGGVSQQRREEGAGALVARPPESDPSVAPRLLLDPVQNFQGVLPRAQYGMLHHVFYR